MRTFRLTDQTKIAPEAGRQKWLLCMKSDWILDILSDLKQYAQENNLPQLTEYLDDTAVIALTEIAGRLEDNPPSS